MNTLLKTLGLAAALIFALVGPIRAQDDAQDNEDTVNNGVSFQTFYDDLASQGNWIQTDQYGYVFQPTETNPDWRPYTYGHWVNTDAGMTWVSDDSFGWATDHYGRWTNIDGLGWVWVPGYTWAPAWVSWREGDDDVGWAPLPPDSDQGIDYYGNGDYDDYSDYGYHIGDDCDLAYDIGPWWYNFCPIVFIGDRDCYRHFHDRRDNFGFIHHTHNVTNINYHRDGAGRFGRVRAEGPSVARLNAQAHTPIRTATLTTATRMNEAGLHGNTLSVFAPRISTATAGMGRPAVVSRSIAGTTVNRGTNISDPPAVNGRLSPQGATPAQIHAAQMVSGSATANNARVATTNTHLSRPLSQPITSLHAGSTAYAATHQGFRTTPSANVSNESRFTGGAERTFPSANESFRSSGTTTRTYSLGDTPVYRESTPAFRPQENFRSYSPAEHYSAPSYHYSAPAEHYSGGFSGGGFHSSGGFSGGGGGGFHGGGGGFSGGGGHGGGGHR